MILLELLTKISERGYEWGLNSHKKITLWHKDNDATIMTFEGKDILDTVTDAYIWTIKQEVNNEK